MKPRIINSINEMQQIRQLITDTVGFVPTMGYLHEGHLSLVKEASRIAEKIIVSIYVNPSQFSPNEDLNSYPRDLDRDIQLLSELDIDFVFFPSDAEMYPNDFKTWVDVDEITSVLCGSSRPTHFKGVTTIVAKLINIISPDFMFMGEKDFQQLVVLQQMVKDLNFNTKVIGCPIVREQDGLAMSSRNKYLSKTQRQQALSLYKSLKLAQDLFSKAETSVDKTKSEMREMIEKQQGNVDYIEIVDPYSLKSVDKVYSGCRALVAVFFDKTRLIDNISIT